MRCVDSCSSPARLRAVSDAATQRDGRIGGRPGERGDAVEPGVVQAGGRQRLGEPPRVRDAQVLEAVEQLVLGVGGGERVERRARRAARSTASRCSATSCSASSRSMPDSTKRPSVELSTSSASASLRGARGAAAAAGLLSSCASPAAIVPSEASRSRFCSMRGDPAHHRRHLLHDAVVDRGWAKASGGSPRAG